MATSAVTEIITKEKRKNQMLGKAMLSNFSSKTRDTLNPEFLDNIEQMVVHHLESFLPPQAAMAVASKIVNDMRGVLTDMINDTQDNAIRLVEDYTSHFSMQIKNAIKNYDKEVCVCIDCHPHHKKE
jgi:hypothetical protein